MLVNFFYNVTHKEIKTIYKYIINRKRLVTHPNLHALLLYCLRLNKFEKCVTMYSLMVRPEIEKISTWRNTQTTCQFYFFNLCWHSLFCFLCLTNSIFVLVKKNKHKPMLEWPNATKENLNLECGAV